MPVDDTRTVVYRIDGTASRASLTMRNETGGTEQGTHLVPWDDTFTVAPGQFVYLSAQNEGDHGTITCTITSDGQVVQTAESSGAYVIAEQIREHHRSTRSVDLSRFSTEEVTSLQQYSLFPNATVLVSADLVSVLVAVPGSAPDRAELVAMHFERSPRPDRAPSTRPCRTSRPTSAPCSTRIWRC